MKNKSLSVTKNNHYKNCMSGGPLGYNLEAHHSCFTSLHVLHLKYARRGDRLQFLLVLLAVDA
jgi:glyoxylate carboligase